MKPDISKWSCDQRVRDANKCCDPHGCHCREITAQHAAIETLTREKAALEADLTGSRNLVAARTKDRDREKERADGNYDECVAANKRADAAESALREALDVTRNLLRRIDNHFNSYPEWDWQEQTAARAFIEEHAPAATSEDK